MELRAGICHLIEADLREICTELHIELKEKGTRRLALIQTVTKYLDAEEVEGAESCGRAEGGKRIGDKS